MNSLAFLHHRNGNLILSGLTGKENKMEEKSEGCTCHGCGRKYNVDLLLPDEIWEQISPKKTEGHKGGGLLCPMCIGQKLEAFGKPDWFHLVKCSPAAGPWIKVSERLPEKNGWYLWKEPDKNYGFVMKAYFWMSEYENRTWVKMQGFTHWAEILPPAEEK